KENITAGSVIYKGIEDNPWITKKELKNIIRQAVAFAEEHSSHKKTLSDILVEENFSSAVWRILGCRNMLNSMWLLLVSHKVLFVCWRAVKINKEGPLNSNQIQKNINALKGKLNKGSALLKKNVAVLYEKLLLGVNQVSISKLTWKDPLASQVISDDSALVQQLPDRQKELFMKPKDDMVPSSLPQIIRDKCNEFVEDFVNEDMDILPRQLKHDGSWKEPDEKLTEIASGILHALNDAWNNPAFSPEFAKLQSEGTYVTNVVVPAIRASLKDLPFGKSTFVSTAEHQSSASADRRGEGRSGRRPDIMFVKDTDDEIKLWREANDGMYWAHKSIKPDKDEFGIVAIQVAGSIIRLNFLIRDVANVHRYYHLYEAKIPVQQSDSFIVENFVKILLTLRNIIIINMSLLFHAPPSRSKRNKSSSTVDSD
ncbi:2986_t:CDS:2, partial [Dentiscutata heterogama]